MNLPLQMCAVVRDPRILTQFGDLRSTGGVRPASLSDPCPEGTYYCTCPPTKPGAARKFHMLRKTATLSSGPIRHASALMAPLSALRSTVGQRPFS